MRTRFVKPALAAVVLIAALAVGVETLRPNKAPKTNAFSAEIRANTALDLDPEAAIPLRKAQPGDFDVTWDAEGGGSLRIMPGSSLRLLANTWRNPDWDDVVTWAHSNLAEIQASEATSVSAHETQFAAVLTSDGNLAVVRIGSHNEDRGWLYWRIESTALLVYSPVQIVTLAAVDPNNAAAPSCAVDFDTGQTIDIPSQTLNGAPEGFLAWLEQNGIDAIAQMSDESGGLAGVGLVFYGFPPGDWAGRSAVQLRGDMSGASHQSRSPILFREGQYQIVHPFKTREGGLGKLQMLGIDRAKRTVQFRFKMVREQASGQAETAAQDDAESLQLAKSQKWIMDLGRSSLYYANDHDDQLPPSVEELRKYANDEEHYRWIVENVEYLGGGHTVAEPPTVPVAYDRTLLATGKGTYVVFLDSHVEFVEPARLARYGLPGGR